MNAYKNRYMAGGVMALLSCLLLFSCNNEDFLDEANGDPVGEYSDHICFGVSPNGTAQTRAHTDAVEDGFTAERFVLRSPDSDDTLCVRAIVSDGIQSSDDRQRVTRATPVTKEEFYDQFHVVAYWWKSGELANAFYMDTDVTKTGDNIWSSKDTYFWPGVGHILQFYAWAPKDAGFTAIPEIYEGTYLNYLDYTVPTDVAEQQDIVVAKTGEIAGDRNTVVPLTFSHIFTAVRFEVGSQIQAGTIKRVALKGVRYKGTYDMAGDGWGTVDQVTGDFTQELNHQTTGSEAEGTEVTESSETFMMLPQTLPDGATVEVEFTDASGTNRTLTASIAGMKWPQGQTVTYRISITPEYELEFISEPELQDAHYIIYPIHIKVGDNVPGGWTITSTDPDKVTLRTELTTLTRRGFWVEEDKGTASISGTDVGDDITVYAFLTENVSDATRNVELQLRPTDRPDATPETFTISQLCPSWNGDLGCERIEDGDYPWGFLWPQGMTITYEMENAGLLDVIKNALLNAYLSWFTDYGQFITKETWLFTITSVTINYDAVPQVNVAQDMTNGLKNTSELYNYNGLSDVSTLISILEDWGGTTTDELPLNPDEFAARACAMKNKYNKTTEVNGGQTIQIPVLAEENLVWYLPAMNEASLMQDKDYALDGDYWTSTVVDNDNERAYKYTAGSSTFPEIRTSNLHVRAVRKKP